MRHRGLVMGVALILLGTAPALAEDEPVGSALAQDDPLWSFSTSLNYSVGDYGTGKNTTLLYVPFTLGVSPIDRLTVSVTVPYLYQTGQTVSLTGGGVAVRKLEAAKLRTGARSRVTRTERGLGDVLLKGSYIVFEEHPFLPEMAPYLKIKFPTADKDKGLGTGEYDETLGVDLSKRLVDGLSAYLTLSYTFIGSPRGEDLRNSFGWYLGAAYAVAQPLAVYAFLDGSTAIAPGQADPVEVGVGAEVRLTKALKLTGSVTRGLTKGAADWGLSAGLALRF